MDEPQETPDLARVVIVDLDIPLPSLIVLALKLAVATLPIGFALWLFWWLRAQFP